MKTESKKTMQEMMQESRRKVALFRAQYPRTFSKVEFMETLDGWDELIQAMSSLIESCIMNYIPEELRDQVYIEQIKQKLGGLRVHMSHHIPQIQGIISMAQTMSYSICEVCGNHATQRNVKGWITALCDTHFQQETEKK
jgi:RNA polymerase-binding transcription factor DksA